MNINTAECPQETKIYVMISQTYNFIIVVQDNNLVMDHDAAHALHDGDKASLVRMR